MTPVNALGKTGQRAKGGMGINVDLWPFECHIYSTEQAFGGKRV